MKVIVYLFVLVFVFIMIYFIVWIEYEEQKIIEERREEITYKNPLICIYDGWNDTIYVDKDTKVMYWWHNSSYKGGLTAMYNADGTPKLYDGDLSKYE